MSRIMIVAGGDWQVELVKKAKKMGHYVICSNLYEDSPAFKYSDVGEVADVLDKRKNLEIAKKYKPDAIISDQSDIAVPTVAYLNEKLGLNGIGIEMADLFTDKSLQRQFCKKNNIEIPDYSVCNSVQDAMYMLEKYQKIIIKPIDSQSSRGVFTIENEIQLQQNIKETLSYSNRINAFLAEEYMEGDEFTVDGIVINGIHYPLCVSIKEMYEQNSNISKRQTYSYLHPIYDFDLLRKTNKNLIEKTGLKMGLTHSEYKFYKNKFYLIEMGARGGGSNLSGKIVPFMSGIDNYEYLINQALGRKVDELKIKNNIFSSEKYVIMQFLDLGEGTVDDIEGVDYLSNNSMLLDYQINVRKGDVLKIPKYGRLRPGHFIIGGDNHEKVEYEASVINKKIRIHFQDK